MDRPSPTAPVGPEPALTKSLPPDIIENQWLVVFRDDVADPDAVSADLVASLGGFRYHLYEYALKGFAVANISPAAVDALRANPLVRWVERDRILMPADVQDVSQYAGQWGLDRIDERARELDGQFVYDLVGASAHVYIVDSGIACGHEEFEGRMGNGAAFISWSWDPSPCIDAQGHGTAVASLAAGTESGAAKGATLHPVRIDDGEDGAYAGDAADGLDWVAGNHIDPAVANLSYTSDSQTVKEAMEGVVMYGVVMVKGAGNANTDACLDDGNNAAGALVVGASDRYDDRAIFTGGEASNFGSCVDLFGPGKLVRAAAGEASGFTDSFGGTSAASPFVAGLAAVVHSDDPSLSPYGVNNAIISSATQGALDGSTLVGSPNLLLYTHYEIPLDAFISGPSFVYAGENNMWSASVTGGVEPYAYAWYRDGQLVSTGSSYTDSAWSDFDLHLEVDDSGGNLAQDDLHVTVSSCPPPEISC